VDPETGEAINRLSEGLDRLGVGLERLDWRFDRLDADVGRFGADVDRLSADFGRLGADLRGEIRASAVETRAYVDERIQVSTTSLLQQMGESESRTRRHFDVVAESLRGDIRAIAEGMVASREQTDRRLDEQAVRTDSVEGRVLRLEVRTSSLSADRKPRRPRRR